MVSAWAGAGGGRTSAGSQGIRRRRFDDLDPALLELTHEGLLLEPVQLVGLDDLVHLRRPDRADVLAGLDQGPQIVLGEQGLDVNRRHGEETRCGSRRVPLRDSHSP